MSAAADTEKFEDAWALYRSWNGELPSDICGVWLAEGDVAALTFGVRDDKNGEMLKEVILDSVENRDSVKFVTQKYLKSELLDIQKNVDIYIEKNIGIEGTYLDEMRNRVEISVLSERVNDRTTQSIVQTIEEKYGDAVHINYVGDMFKQSNLAVGNSGSGNGDSKWGSTRFIILVVCMTIVILASGYMVIMKKRGQLVDWAEKHGFKPNDTDKAIEKTEATDNAAADETTTDEAVSEIDEETDKDE